MKDLGGFPDSLMLESQSGGVMRLTDKGTSDGVGREKHSRQKEQPGGSLSAGGNTMIRGIPEP